MQNNNIGSLPSEGVRFETPENWDDEMTFKCMIL